MNLKVVRKCKGWRERVWLDRVSKRKKKNGLKEFESLCFRDCGAGHVSNSAQHPYSSSNLLYSYLFQFSLALDV